MSYKRRDFIPVVTVGDTVELDYLSARYIDMLKNAPVFRRHTVKTQENGRLDMIAARPEIYDNPDMYWIIAYKNKIINPILDMYTGMVLEIPSLTNVENNLSERSTNNVNQNSKVTLR